jgi:hypothetical protein
MLTSSAEAKLEVKPVKLAMNAARAVLRAMEAVMSLFSNIQGSRPCYRLTREENGTAAGALRQPH